MDKERCLKTRHATKKHARIAMRHKTKSGDGLNIYWCKECKAYHVGHHKNQGRKKR